MQTARFYLLGRDNEEGGGGESEGVGNSRVKPGSHGDFFVSCLRVYIHIIVIPSHRLYHQRGTNQLTSQSIPTSGYY